VTGYGSAPIVRGVSVAVRPGEVVVLLGANGSGKSTLLKGIAGLLKCSSGTVSLLGRDVTGLTANRLAALGMGYVPQGDDTFASLTVRENLELGGYLLGRRAIHVRVSELLEEVPLIGRLSHRVVATLSGGERKLVAIARALMLRPKVLLLDEPTASLTPEMTELILKRFVRQVADQTTGVLLVEQKAMEALRVGDLAHVLVDGQVFLTDSPAALADKSRLAAAFFGVDAPPQAAWSGGP
jgi:branched-chain amino acid transport system ATP-binding protein